VIMRFVSLLLLPLLLVAPAAASEPLQDLRVGGLLTGMTIAQVREAAQAASPRPAVSETARPDGSPWIVRLKTGNETTAAFVSRATKGGKVYRLSLSLPLGDRAMSTILAEWTKRFGPPDAMYYADGKRAAQVGWGFRPGPQGLLEKVGANHLRLLGEVSTTNKMINLTLLDDDEAD